jgi:NitT/TauT family transport system substrate-binding protein
MRQVASVTQPADAAAGRPFSETKLGWILVLTATAVLLMSGCTLPSFSAVAATTTVAPGAGPRLVIYAPATPSSIPVIIAARHMENTEITIFTNHSQAHTLFLRGDVTILVTGLSVGVEFFRSGVPVQVINSYVSGLTYLVTAGRKVDSFGELRGQEIYIPFEGSPIEEITQFFVEQEGLTWKQDIKPIYSSFLSSVELLKQGRVANVALPEPYVSLVEKQQQVFVSLNYRQEWDALTGSADGYPQVGTFVRQDWAAAHPDLIAQFNDELVNALQIIEQDPAAAVEQTQAELGFPLEVLLSSLQRTDFSLSESGKMAQEIRRYYQIIGKPLDETFELFFYDHHQ